MSNRLKELQDRFGEAERALDEARRAALCEMWTLVRGGAVIEDANPSGEECVWMAGEVEVSESLVDEFLYPLYFGHEGKVSPLKEDSVCPLRYIADDISSGDRIAAEEWGWRAPGEVGDE